jgi:hypothetical protein
MTRYPGHRIVSLFPGLDQTLQDSLLAAIESVLIEAEAERIWIEESPSHDLRVHALLPPADAPEAPVVPIGSAPSAVTISSSVSVPTPVADQASAETCSDTESVE